MKPVFILVRPQLAENVGTAARAMMNCAIDEMRLVDPDEDHLCSRAICASSGAEEILKNAKVFKTVHEAIADLQKVYATTGRPRDMVKPIFTGVGMAQDLNLCLKKDIKCGVLFGPERTGLENQDMDEADAIVKIPLNPEHTSLNLAQAILLVGYEIFRLSDSTKEYQFSVSEDNFADKTELKYFFNHLDRVLEERGYYPDLDKKPRMVRNLQNIFLRAQLTSQEIRTLHGVIDHLSK
ncbi:MAG: RNA methyltransferase [Alphaproteobacteria bacterium]|nr:RNA methyltransferase [Alphaproteobacteria bacterium]